MYINSLNKINLFLLILRRQFKLLFNNISTIFNSAVFFLTANFILALLYSNSPVHIELIYGLNLIFLLFSMEFSSKIILENDAKLGVITQFKNAELNIYIVIIAKLLAQYVIILPIFCLLTYANLHYFNLFSDERILLYDIGFILDFILNIMLMIMFILCVMTFISTININIVDQTKNVLNLILIIPFSIPVILIGSNAIVEHIYLLPLIVIDMIVIPVSIYLTAALIK